MSRLPGARAADLLAVSLGLVTAATLSLATVARADNFGGPKDASAACDATTSSECVANDANHSIYYSSNVTSADWLNGADAAINDYYNNTTSLIIWHTPTYSASNDVRLSEVDTSNNLWGWGRCASSPTATGHLATAVPAYAHGLNWCYPQLVFLNDHYASTAGYNNATGKRAIACHEIGHTLGLRHRNTTPYGCMANPPNYAGSWHTTPQSHDYGMINYFYP
jgi:hypothetical protein